MEAARSHEGAETRLAGQPFTSKAATLEWLQPRLKSAKILPLSRIALAAYRKHPEATLDAVLARDWARRPLAVRSSARGEDCAEASEAGRFESVLNVEGPAALRVAIETVIASYPAADLAHEILIQPMLENVAASGVAFSRDPNTGAPYAVISYSEGDDTRAVTGGNTRQITTILSARTKRQPADLRIGRIAALLEEIERLTGTPCVDIEFAFDSNDALYLFQARPLVMKVASDITEQEHAATLSRIESQLDLQSRPHPFLRGRRTLFGVMPDWNPAEMIGIRPRPLALSLYRELITDVIWAYQRNNYGYRNLRSFPLLHDFFGLPYIDVRVSFNSFIPDDIPDELAEKLANYYIDALAARPALHDKVEFEIIFSCYTLDLQSRANALANAGFTHAEIEIFSNSLRHLTNRIINNRNGLWRQDTAKLDTLSERHAVIAREIGDPITNIFWLLEDCKRYGTLPFAGLARAGFIAVQTLRSLVAVGALSQRDYDGFLASLETVSSQMSRDLTDLGRNAFLARYGHLRPGTYDIRSPRYDVEPDLYFNWSNQAKEAYGGGHHPFALTLPQMNRINRLLEEHGLEHDVVGLFNFLKAAIEGREKAKFLFTRNLSDALETLAALGTTAGLSRDDLSYADIKSILTVHTSCEDAAEALRRSIENGRKRHALTCSISLPTLITSPQDVWHVKADPVEPNYITQLDVRAPVANHESTDALKGAIVVIPSADPGFDWLFSHGIGGLITAYGGVNSHMAIRAGELRIPAVIGAGERLFKEWSNARILHVDCANRRVEKIA